MRGLLLLALAITVAGCGGQSARHYSAVLDELRPPGSWELVHTEVREPGVEGELDCFGSGPCPTVSRFYLASSEPIEIYPDVKGILEAAGFVVTEELAPNCDLTLSGAACYLVAVRDRDQIGVSLYNPGDDFDGLGLAQGGRSLIRFVANQT